MKVLLALFKFNSNLIINLIFLSFKYVDWKVLFTRVFSKMLFVICIKELSEKLIFTKAKHINISSIIML